MMDGLPKLDSSVNVVIEKGLTNAMTEALFRNTPTNTNVFNYNFKSV